MEDADWTELPIERAVRAATAAFKQANPAGLALDTPA